MQAQSLSGLIDTRMTRGPPPVTLSDCVVRRSLNVSSYSTEGYIGMALAGGAAAIGTLIIAGLVRRAARK